MDAIKSFVARSNSGHLFGFALTILAIAHIPLRFQQGIFDRNAAPQFIILTAIALISSFALARKKSIRFTPLVVSAGIALVAASLLSFSMSDSAMTSLIGDTGRYAGMASLFALITLAIFASTLDSHRFSGLVLTISIGIILVTVLGFLQSLNILKLPTGAGVGSTLGNLDFLSAWIGTTSLLLLITWRIYRIKKLYLVIISAVSIFTLWKIEAKQGFLDLGIALVFLALYFLKRKFDLLHLSALAWKAIATFAILLWSEAIYLIPMLKLPIPGIGNDPQVSIRSDFWFSAAQMFAHHFGFGVGPDNYGNFYEKYRSLHSIKTTELVLANDAHSSMLQSFASLGIFATLSLLLLILAVIYAAIDLYLHSKNVNYLIALLTFFIFYTNSLISPMTLPNKAIFWVIGGYLLGAQANLRVGKTITVKRIYLAPFSATTGVVLLTALFLFLPSFVKFDSALAANHQGKAVKYSASDSLPCTVYAGAQLQLVARSAGDVEEAALKIVRNYPRCLDALSYLASKYMAEKNYPLAQPFIYQLLDVAPGRNSVVRMAAIYAMATNDEALKNVLTSQGLKLGILSDIELR